MRSLYKLSIIFAYTYASSIPKGSRVNKLFTYSIKVKHCPRLFSSLTLSIHINSSVNTIGLI